MTTAFSILWSPAAHSERAARAGLALPMILLGAGNALPNYTLLLHHGATQLLEYKLAATPMGLYPSSAFFFIGLVWISPFLLPLLALLGAWLLDYYVGFVLDTKTQRREILRIVAWGFLPIAMQRVLAAGIEIACRGGECDRFNPLASNAGFFLLQKETDIFWYEMATGVDVFAAWAIAVTGVALAARYQRSAAATIFGVAFLYLFAVFVRAMLIS